jgi:hypothetical protein
VAKLDVVIVGMAPADSLLLCRCQFRRHRRKAKIFFCASFQPFFRRSQTLGLGLTTVISAPDRASVSGLALRTYQFLYRVDVGFDCAVRSDL